MGDIIEFRQSINTTNKYIKEKISNLAQSINNIKPSIDENEIELLNEMNFFEAYFNNLIIKINDRNWKSERKEEKYINYYNSFNDKSNLSELDKIYFLSLFTYCSDINSSLLDEDFNYIKLVVESIDRNLYDISLSNVRLINSIIKDSTRPMIKNIVLNSDDPSFTLYDIIDGLSNGIDIYTVSLWYKNNYNMEAVTIDEDNLTLDNIREFYLNQEKLRYIDRCNHIDEFEEIEREHEINSLFINAIYNIKGFNDEYQDIYLNIVKKILSKENIDRQIRDIINLTKVYLEFGEQITEFSIEEIEHYIELGGKKYENR